MNILNHSLDMPNDDLNFCCYCCCDWNLFIFSSNWNQTKTKKSNSNNEKWFWWVKFNCKKFSKFAIKTVSHYTHFKLYSIHFKYNHANKKAPENRRKTHSQNCKSQRFIVHVLVSNIQPTTISHWTIVDAEYFFYFISFLFGCDLYTLYTSAIECNCLFMTMVVMFCLLFLVWVYFVFYSLLRWFHKTSKPHWTMKIKIKRQKKKWQRSMLKNTQKMN